MENGVTRDFAAVLEAHTHACVQGPGKLQFIAACEYIRKISQVHLEVLRELISTVDEAGIRVSNNPRVIAAANILIDWLLGEAERSGTHAKS